MAGGQTFSLEELEGAPVAPPPARQPSARQAGPKTYSLDELGAGPVAPPVGQPPAGQPAPPAANPYDTNYLLRALGRGYQNFASSVDTMAADARVQNMGAIDKWQELSDRMDRLVDYNGQVTDPTTYQRLSTARSMVERDIRTALPGSYDLRDARARDELKGLLGRRAGANIVSNLERGATIQRQFPREKITDQAFQNAGAEETWFGPRERGFGESLGQFWDTFSKAPIKISTEIAAESLPTAGAAIVAGMLTRNPAIAAGFMGALSGTQEYGAGIMEALRDSGVDVTKPDAVLAALRDPKIGAIVREKAALKAVPVAALDALSLKLGSVILAPKALGPVGRAAANLPAQSLAQGALGGTGEALGQLASEGRVKSWPEVFAEVVGEAGAGPIEAMGMRHVAQSTRAEAGTQAGPGAIAAVRDYLAKRFVRTPPAANPQAAAPEAAPAIPPEVQAVLDASGIRPGTPLYRAAAESVAQRLAAEKQRPAPGAFDAGKVDDSVDAQRSALEAEAAAREAQAQGMTTYVDPATGQDTSVARAPMIPRTQPPSVISLPQNRDFVPGRTQEDVARVEDIRQRDQAAAAAAEADQTEQILSFLRRTENPPASEPARGEFQYAAEARRPLTAAETLSPEALRLAEATGRPADRPIAPGAAGALERFARSQQRSQAEADNADRNMGPFRVGDTTASEPRPGLGTNAPSAPQDVAAILRDRQALQRERDYALGQATNQTITDTERAKWRKRAEALGPQIEALSAKLDAHAQRAGQSENRSAPTKEKVLEKQGASVATGTSDRPFRAQSTGEVAQFRDTPELRTRFARGIGIDESQIDTNLMTRAVYENWVRGLRQTDARAARANDTAFEGKARDTFERMRRRTLDELEAEWARSGAQRKASEQARQSEAGAAERAGTVPKGLDEQGNYHVDENGYVLSDKGGPILFETQKDAGRWILKYGNKNSRGQVFDIANHPDVFGKFSVIERMRREPPGAGTGNQPPSGKGGPLVPAGGPPLPNKAGPRAEAVSEPGPPPDINFPPTKIPPSSLRVDGKPYGKKRSPLQPPAEFKPTPQQMGEARSVLARISGSGPRRKPQRLVDFVIAEGGVRPNSVDAGSLRAMDLHKRPGFFSNGPRAKTVDQMAVHAVENGFIRRRADVDPKAALLEALGQDAGGKPVYRADDQATIDFHDREGKIQGLVDYLESHGIATNVKPREMAWLLSLDPQEARLRTLLNIEINHSLTDAQSLEKEALLDAEMAKAAEAEYNAAKSERPEAFDPELEGTYHADAGLESQPTAAPEAGNVAPEGAAKPQSDANAVPPSAQRADAQPETAGARDGGKNGADGSGRDGHTAAEAVKPAEARPTVDQTDQGSQPVIPGAERLTEREMQQRDLAKRAAAGKMQPKVRQQRADDGLFDVAGRGQSDMFTAKPAEAPKAEAAPKAEEAQTEQAANHDVPHDGMTPGAREYARQYKNDPNTLAKRRAAANEDVRALAAQYEARKENEAFRKRFDEANQKLADMDDALEWIEQTAAEREASRAASKFYSNPFMDPKVWGGLFRMVDPRKVGRAFASEMQAWADGFTEIAELFTKSNRKQKGNPFLDLLRTIAYSNDGMLTVLAHRYKVGKDANPVIQEFRRLWHAQPGRASESGIQQTYGEAVAERTQARLNDLVDVLEPLKNMDRKTAAGILDVAARKMRARNIPAKPVTPADKVAAGLRDFFAQELKYQRDIGIDIGKVDGYLPRVVDVAKVHSNIGGFLNDATKAYRMNGLDGRDARAAAEAWLDRLLMGDMGISAANNDLVLNQTGSMKPSFEKGRELNRAAEKVLENWYINDPAALAGDYVVRATRRGELARRLGPKLEKWGDFKEKLAESGAAEALPDIIDIVRSTAGLYPSIRNRALRHSFAFLRLLTPLTYLERATVTSLSEPAILGSRTAGAGLARDLIPVETLSAYLKTAKGLLDRARGHKNEAAQLAEDFGLIGNVAHGTLMQQRFGGQIDAQWAQGIMNGFFRRTGLHDFTDTTREVGAGVGRVFLRRLALRSQEATDNPVWGTKKSTEFLLGELGIPADKIGQFADWVLKAPNGMPIDDAVRGADTKDPMARLYRTAISRFVDQALMRPKSAERQRWANHPVGSVFYGITSFIASFHKNVVMRGLSMMRQSVDPRSGLSAYERLNFLMPALRVAVTTVAIQFALTFLRDELWDDPAKDPEKKRQLDEPGPLGVSRRMALAISRSGITGLWDIPYNWAFGTKFVKDPAAVASGPMISGIMELLKAGIGMVAESNSPNTNTAERNFGRAVYDYAFSPVLNGIFSLMPGRAGALLGAAGIQATSHPKARENLWTEPMFGPPRWQTAGGANSRGSRSTGRGARGPAR